MHRKYLFRHQPHPQGLRLVPLPAPLLAPATARELGVAACMFGGAAAPPGGALHPGPLAATHPIPLTLYPPTDHTSPGASVPLFALFISNRLALRCAQLNSWVGSSLAASLAACLPGCEACLFFPSPHIWLSSPAAPGCLWPAAPHCTTPHPPRPTPGGLAHFTGPPARLPAGPMMAAAQAPAHGCGAFHLTRPTRPYLPLHVALPTPLGPGFFPI